MAAIQIWLREELSLNTRGGTSRSIQLPVVPDKVTVASGNDLKRMTLCELGEVVIPGNRMLRTLSLASYFPARYDPNCAYHNIPRPQDAVKLLRDWCENGTVARLIIRGGGFSINMTVLVEKFETTMASPAKDVAWDMTLTEHRALTVKEYRGAVIEDGHIVSNITVSPPPLPPEKRRVKGYTPPAESPIKKIIKSTLKTIFNAALRTAQLNTRPGGSPP